MFELSSFWKTKYLIFSHSNVEVVFFKLGFIQHKAEEPPQGMESQERENSDEKHRGKLIRKIPKIKDAY